MAPARAGGIAHSGHRCFVGFYWTFPVPFVGFTRLPKDVDAAAAASWTIRYQRQSVQTWVSRERGRLVGEFAFMEVEPDRGTSYVADVLQKAFALCEANSATLVYVRFGEVRKTRQHSTMMGMLDEASVPVEPLPPEPIDLDGVTFDPFKHFAAWKKRLGADKAAHEESLPAEVEAALAQSEAEGKGSVRTAEILNEGGIKTPTGRSWAVSNLHAYLKKRRL